MRTKQFDISGYEGLLMNALTKMTPKKGEEKLMGTGKTTKLIDYLMEEIRSKDIFDEDSFKSTIELLTDWDPNLFKTLTKQFDKELTEEKAKKVIIALSRNISGMIKRQEFREIIHQMDRKLKYDSRSIEDFHGWVREKMAEMEPHSMDDVGENDPAIISYVTLSNKEEVNEIYKSVKTLNEDGGRYVTGFQGLNDMVFGGFKPGENFTIGALKHNYKTGFSLSVFLQLVTLNKPIMKKKDIAKGLRPLAVRISFEDEVSDNMEFAYKYFKGVDGTFVKTKDLKAVSPEEMTEYVQSKTNVNGWETIIMKVNPNDWSFAHLSNFILGLEAQGYALCILALDYLTLLPTTGCKTGAVGADYKDLFKKTKHFCSARGAFMFTPLQLNSEVTRKLEMGVSDARIMREVCMNSPYAESKALGHEIDVESFVHVVYHNGAHWLNIVRGKRKGTEQVEREEMKCVFYKFAMPNVPLMPDFMLDRQFLYHLPRAGMQENTSADDILSEVIG